MNSKLIKAMVTDKYGSINEFCKQENINQTYFYLAMDSSKLEEIRQKIVELIPEAKQFM